MRKTFCFPLLIAAMLCLAACQPTPESAVVASKNDGAFEAALESAAESRPETEADETVGGGEQGLSRGGGNLEKHACCGTEKDVP